MNKMSILKDFDVIKFNQQIAYKGRIGQLRHDFVVKQIQELHKAHKQIRLKQLKEIQKDNNHISCHAGCTYCCYDFIGASLQECESIVYYLYQNPNILSLFLKQYEHWWVEIEKRNATNILDKMYQHIVQMWNTGFDQKNQDNSIIDSVIYRDMNIPCPFLRKRQCLIYEVRPIACASICTTTPEEWCNPKNPNRQKRNVSIVLPKENAILPMYHKSFSSFVTIGFCMPLLVYIILKGGYLYLSKLLKSDELWLEIKSDPKLKHIFDNGEVEYLLNREIGFD